MSEMAVGKAAAHAPRGNTAPAMIRPGTLSRFYAWCDHLPWHGWWLFPVIALVELAWANGILWATGRLPMGEFDPTLSVAVIYGPYALGALAYLHRVAARALEVFWPATGWPDSERSSWTQAFTTISARLGLPSLLLGTGVAAGSFLSAPASVVGLEDRDRLIYAVALAPIAILGYTMTLLAIAHTTRQLQLVARIHREARAIDAFDRASVYAFSRFTAQIGLVFLVSGYYTLTVNSSWQSGNFIGLVVLGLVIALGAACFVVPLWGIHGRLVREKEALLAGVEERIRKLRLELYRRIDAGEFDGTNLINEAMAAAGVIEARIARLPTWPWPPQLFRGFLSALLLPVIVYLITRLIGGRIGI